MALFITFQFKTREQCKQIQYAIIRHKNFEKRDMTGEEMHEKYQQKINPPPPPMAVKKEH